LIYVNQAAGVPTPLYGMQNLPALRGGQKIIKQYVLVLTKEFAGIVHHFPPNWSFLQHDCTAS
jgi:hypothetical protein